jgi:hypothetical protein
VFLLILKNIDVQISGSPVWTEEKHGSPGVRRILVSCGDEFWDALTRGSVPPHYIAIPVNICEKDGQLFTKSSKRCYTDPVAMLPRAMWSTETRYQH